MQKRTKLQQQLLVAGCAGILLASTGCRSAMPKWNMFSSKAPSAETLAGAGPTITYPAPPSESATPGAIASVAGGTAESIDPNAIVTSAPPTIAPVSGFDATSRADLASSATNNAAARANGFNLASNRTVSAPATGGLPGYAAPSAGQGKSNSTVPAIPAGYQFGTKKSAPKPQTPSASGYAMPSAYPAPGVAPTTRDSVSAYTLPNTSAPAMPTTIPNKTTPGFGLPAGGIPTPTAASGSGGFAMPDSMVQSVKAAAGGATNSQPFTPKPPTITASATLAPPTGMKLPSGSAHSTPATTVSTGGSSPSFSTASAALAPRSNESLKNGSGYAPGSTSSSGSYPTTSGYPNTGTDGSFYR